MSHVVEVVLNYLIIQFSILAFVAPFYILYRYHHPGISWKRLMFNTHLEDFLSSHQANYLAFTWAAGEAIFWFVIPEFLLLLVIFLRVQRKRILLMYDILGTLFGTVVGLGLSLYTSFKVMTVPYITPNMVEQVRVWYHGLGSFGLFFQPFSGIPYKVFVMNAFPSHLHLLGFLFLAVAVRVARYYLFYSIFAGLYPFLYRWVSRHYLPIFFLSCFIFSVLLLKVYHFYGKGYVIDTREIQAVRNVVLWIKESAVLK